MWKLRGDNFSGDPKIDYWYLIMYLKMNTGELSSQLKCHYPDVNFRFCQSLIGTFWAYYIHFNLNFWLK